MYLYHNELSTRKPAEDIHTAKKWIEGFIKICKELKNHYKLKKVFISDDFYSNTLFHEFPVSKLIENDIINQGKNLLRDKFFKVISDYPDNFNAQDYTIGNNVAIGLGLSYVSEKPAISFLSEELWEEASIQLDNNLIVKNISKNEHIQNHKSTLDKHLSETLEIPDDYDFENNPLPLSEHSSVKFDVGKKLTEIKALRTDKKAAYDTLCTQIAEFNKLKHEAKVSSLNSNSGQLRKIFKAGEGRKTYYLSIDFENGAFELFKRLKGSKEAEHLGEYSSETGENTGKAKHPNIKLK